MLPTFGVDLADRVVVPYVMNAKTLADKGFVKPTGGGLEATCDEILDPTKHPEVKVNEDHWVLDPLPQGTLLKERSFSP